jgi:hypothetical protein
MSTVLKILGPNPVVRIPPPNRAIFETEVAAGKKRASLSVIEVHNSEVTLKTSTMLWLYPELSCPPPNRAMFKMDVAGK